MTEQKRFKNIRFSSYSGVTHVFTEHVGLPAAFDHAEWDVELVLTKKFVPALYEDMSYGDGEDPGPRRVLWFDEPPRGTVGLDGWRRIKDVTYEG